MTLAVEGMVERALDDSRVSTVTLNLGSERSDLRRTLPREPLPWYGVRDDGWVGEGGRTYSDENNVLVSVSRHVGRRIARTFVRRAVSFEVDSMRLLFNMVSGQILRAIYTPQGT